jgi:hypothetical protein
LLKPYRALIRQNLLYAEGDFGDRHCRQSQFGIKPNEPVYYRRLGRDLRNVSDRMLVSRKIKDPGLH